MWSRIVRLLPRLLLAVLMAVADRPYRKLDYTVNPTYQDQIDNEEGFPPQPTFSSTPESFVYGGIFSISDLEGNPLPDGYQDVLSMQCAIAEVNRIAKERGENTTFYYNIYNDQTNPAAAVRVATVLYSAGVPVTIGPTESDAASSVAALYASFNSTIISGSATAVSLSDASVYGSFFRTIPSDFNAADAITDLMLYFNWTLVTPIYSRDQFGLSGQQEFTSAAIAKGILQTCGRVIPPGQLTGLQSTINCLTSSQSTVVLLWMQASDAAAVISSFYNSTVLPSLTFIGPDSWGDLYGLQAYADDPFPSSYLEGTFGVVPRRGDQSNYVDCVSGLKATSESIPGFLDYWESSLKCLVDKDDDIPLCDQSILDRPSFPNITCRCLPTDNLGLLNATHKVNYIYDAIFAAYNALEQIDKNCTGLTEETKVDYCAMDTFTTANLQQVIGVSAFEGFTGLVAFNGNDPVTIRYDIVQRRSGGEIVLVGAYTPIANDTSTTNGTSVDTGAGFGRFAALATEFNVTINDSLLEFKNGEVPVSQIVPTEITFSDPLGIVALIFIIIGLVMAISFSIYFFVNRNEKVIKKTSPFFSQLMLLGILLCITSQIFWDVSQSKFTCLVKIWLLAIGFGLIMGNLLAKTYRIFKIFSNAKVTSLVIRDTDLLIFTGSIIVLEIILLSCYSFPSGLPRPVVIQSTSDSLLKIIKCQVPSSFLQTGGTIWLLGVNFLLVLAAVIIAYLTRNVDSAFNESRYIAYTVYVFLLVTIILLPLYYTAGDSSSSNSRQFIIRTLAILVSMFFCLGALFLPKIYLVHKAKKAERKAAEAGAEREQERRLVDVGTTTVGVTGLPTSGYTEGSMGGGGAYSRVLRGSSTTGGTGTTSSGSGEETVIMPGGPRVSSSTADQSSSAAGATTPSTTGGPGNEYSSLISSLAKRSK